MCALHYAFDARNFVSLFYKIVKVDHAVSPVEHREGVGAAVSINAADSSR